MIVLNQTTDTVEVVLSAGATTRNCPVLATWVDWVQNSSFTPQRRVVSTNGVTPATAVTAPAAGVYRQVKLLTVYNADTVSQRATVSFSDNGTLYATTSVLLGVGSTLMYTDGEGFKVLDATGSVLGAGTPGAPGASGMTLVLGDDSGGGDDGMALPGPQGVQGLQGLPGPVLFCDTSDCCEDFSLPAGVMDDAVVHKTGTETITGNKTLTGGISSIAPAGSGTTNEAFGNQTLFSNTTGSGNTAVGNQALYSNLGGGNNCAFGSQAAYSNTSGGSNFAIGLQTLYANTTGSFNVGLGIQCLQTGTAINNNVAIGYQALSVVTTDSSVAVGYKAGTAQSTGFQNVLVGFQAGKTIVGGAGDVCIGTNSGGTTLISGSNNVLVGQSTDTQATNTANGIALGASALCASNEFAVGPGINFQQYYGLSSTSAKRARGVITVANIDNTDATRKYKMTLGAFDTAQRDTIAIETDGTYGQANFLNGLANGQKLQVLAMTELLTIAASATSATAIQIPAGAVVFAVSVRVTVVIPTAATFTVAGTGSGTTFNTAAVAVAATTTDAGTAAGCYYNATAQTITITPNLTPGANTGRVRVTLHYYQTTPPTS